MTELHLIGAGVCGIIHKEKSQVREIGVQIVPSPCVTAVDKPLGLFGGDARQVLATVANDGVHGAGKPTVGRGRAAFGVVHGARGHGVVHMPPQGQVHLVLEDEGLNILQ